MRRHLSACLSAWLGSVGLSLIASGCIVSAAPEPLPITTPSYGFAPASDATVGEPSPYEVSSMPPEPLYEQMTASPGYGYVWIDGYWHWNGYEWVWVSGRWEREQDGYAYVAPYYAYNDGAYIYTPGYWRNQRSIPSGWATASRGEGRPIIVRPPQGYRPIAGNGRPGVIMQRPPQGQAPPPGQPIGYRPPPTYETGGNLRAPVTGEPPRGPIIYEREPESRFPPQAPHPDPEPYAPSRPTVEENRPVYTPVQQAPQQGERAPVYVPSPQREPIRQAPVERPPPPAPTHAAPGPTHHPVK